MKELKKMIEDMNQIFVKNQFKMKTIDSNDSRTVIVYQYKSSAAKDFVSIHLAVIPLQPFVIKCMAYAPTVCSVNTIDKILIEYNWMRETSDRFVNRFKIEFVPKVIEILSFGLNDMPIEIIDKIVERLAFGPIIRLSMTNKYWKEICEQNDLWRKLFRKRFSNNSFRRFAYNSANIYSN